MSTKNDGNDHLAILHLKWYPPPIPPPSLIYRQITSRRRFLAILPHLKEHGQCVNKIMNSMLGLCLERRAWPLNPRGPWTWRPWCTAASRHCGGEGQPLCAGFRPAGRAGYKPILKAFQLGHALNTHIIVSKCIHGTHVFMTVVLTYLNVQCILAVSDLSRF